MTTAQKSNYAGTIVGVGAPSVEGGRERLLFWLFFAASANSVVGLVIRSVLENGAAYATFDLFGLSAIVWAGIAAGLAIVGEQRGEEPTRSDYVVTLLAALMILLPMANASSLALTLLATYSVATGPSGSNLRRAGIIFLSISVSLFWGRLILALFSRSLLGIDAFFVTNVVGAKQVGNQVFFVGDAQDAFVIAPGCSSLQGMSLAFVFWATVTQWYRVPFSLRSATWCAAAVAATLAINVMRLGAIAHFPQHFDAIHTGWGWHLASLATLAAIVGIVMYGARNEVFKRA